MNMTINDIEVCINRKKIKNMHLYVKPPDGRVEVSAPFSVSEESVRFFVASHLDWIRKRQATFAAQARLAPREYVSGESFYVWGQKYYLRVVHESPTNSLKVVGEYAYLNVSPLSTVADRERVVNEWYRAELKNRIEVLLPVWSARTGLVPSSWQIKQMKTKWGTCNTTTRKIWINLQLAKKPMICLEYLILHELAHLKVAGHGPRFKAILDHYLPHWREIRKTLNTEPLDTRNQ